MVRGSTLLRFVASSALLICGLIVSGANASAQSPYDEIDWALDDRSIAVAWIDPAKADLGKVETLLKAIDLPMDKNELDQAVIFREAMVSAKVTRVYGLVDLGVISSGRPTYVFSTKDLEATTALVSTMMVPGDGLVATVFRDSEVVFGPAERVGTLVSTSEKTKNKKLSDLLHSVKGDHGMVATMPRSSRDLIGELLKSQPNAGNDESRWFLEALRRFDNCQLGINGAVKSFQLDMGFDSPDDASEFSKLTIDQIVKGVGLPDDVKPVVQGKTIHWQVDNLEGLLRRLKSSPMIQKARDEAALMSKMNNLKQVALALHNFESAYRTIVPQALASKDGKRLLSWRVMVLPFIEQQELYEQFHLDEPWDSEHNRKLVAKMPTVYGDDPTGKGLATVQVLLTPNSVFGRKGKPVQFSDITDGTSNTIWFTEVDAKDAVVWTKPEDYSAVSEEAFKKLFANREKVPFCFVDGSVRLFSKSLGFELFQKAITIDGGEAIELP